MGTSLITALSLAAIVAVGMALALSKFCFVVTVLGVRSGNLSPARCVVGLSFLIAISLLALAQWRGGETMPIYNPQLAVVFGGLVFGLAARSNGGCFVGTINGLCKGEAGRLLTIAGWVLGYALLRRSPIPGHHQTPLEVGLVLGGLGACLLVLNRRARRQHQCFLPNPKEPSLQGGVAWALMLTTGILVGLLHHSGLPWTPSNLARALGDSLRGIPLGHLWAYALLTPLGMALVHGLRGDFSPVPIRRRDLRLLPIGMLMAMGSVWGMGANDTYLFRYLPLGSMHAALGLTAMAAGILLGDWLGTISPIRHPRTPTPP
jgi:hypothetical protein